MQHTGCQVGVKVWSLTTAASELAVRPALRPWRRRMRRAKRSRRKTSTAPSLYWSASSKIRLRKFHSVKPESHGRGLDLVEGSASGFWLTLSDRTRRERTPKKKRHFSRSRSISAASVTSSSHRGKKGRAKKRQDFRDQRYSTLSPVSDVSFSHQKKSSQQRLARHELATVQL